MKLFVTGSKPMTVVVNQNKVKVITVAKQGAPGAGSSNFIVGEAFPSNQTRNGVNQDFVIPYTINTGSESIYFGQGRLMRDLGYTISGSNVHFLQAPTADDAIFFDCIKVST